ncbi:MAG: hypothetical protein ACE5EA_06675 [Nitrospirota bacterium]
MLQISMAVINVWICLMVGFIGGNDRVLCFGWDGHTAVEMTHLLPSSSAASREVFHASSLVKSTSKNDHSSSCIDIPIILNSSFRQNSVSFQEIVSQLNASIYMDISFIIPTSYRITTQVSSLQQPSMDDSIHASIHTTILLI